ncbi:MAG: hypothetical protein HQK89_07055 [Nitrospirae bacterium]|nr:hypothetical protein [Nitrospirota bacterium]
MGALIKIAAYLVFATAVFILSDARTFYILGITALLILVAYPGRKMLRGLIPLSIFLGVTFFSNLASGEGRVLLVVFGYTITQESLTLALVATIRVFLLVVGVKALMLSTVLDEIVEALGILLSPFKLLKLPVDDFLEVFVMSLKVFPFIKEELKASYDCRIGESLTVGAFGKAKALFGVLVPSLVEIIAHPEKFYRKYGVDNARPEEPAA